MSCDSHAIKQNLLQIKHSQLQLLQQLKNQHSILQGYISHDITPYDHSLDQNKILENSLDLSKSDIHEHSLQPIVEEKYRKIEELLLKQRKMQEESHALQKENQSLTFDYLELKKLYNRQKQQSKALDQNYHLLGHFYESLVRDLLLAIPHEQLVQKYSKLWRQNELQSPKIDGKWAKKSIDILGEKYIVRPISPQPNYSHMSKEIQSLKRQLGILLQTKKEHQELKVGSRRTICELQQKIQTKAKSMDELNQMKNEADRKMRLLQNELIEVSSQNSKLKGERINLKKIIGQKEKQFQKIIQSKTQLEQKLNKHQDETQSISKSMKEKEQMLESQGDLTKKQKMLLDKQSIQLNNLKQEINSRRGQQEHELNRYKGMEQNLRTQLNRIMHEYQQYRDVTSRQMGSQKNYIFELKKQCEGLMRVEEKNKTNEMKYMEMMAKRQNTVRLTAMVEHLWEVKEVEYGNVMQVLGNVSPK